MESLRLFWTCLRESPTSLYKWLEHKIKPSCHIEPDFNLSSVTPWKENDKIGFTIQVFVYIHNHTSDKITIHTIGLSERKLNRYVFYRNFPIIVQKNENAREWITIRLQRKNTWWNSLNFKFPYNKDVFVVVKDSYGRKIRIIIPNIDSKIVKDIHKYF